MLSVSSMKHQRGNKGMRSIQEAEGMKRYGLYLSAKGIANLKRRAEANRRSLSAELTVILEGLSEDHGAEAKQ